MYTPAPPPPPSPGSATGVVCVCVCVVCMLGASYVYITYCMFSSPVHAQSLTCQVNGGVVSCPPVACPGDQVTFTATVLPAVGSNIWLLPTGTCSGSTTPDSIVLTQTANACRSVTMPCGPYTATNADPGASKPCLTSTLSVTATSSMTSSVIKTGTQDVSANSVIVNTTQITVIGKSF